MKYVAFLRGINVGARTMIKMETLRETFAALGFENVKTYINSGNVLFETRETDDKKLAARIAEAVEKNFFKTPVMVRSVDEIREIVENNPFAGQFENHKDLHVLFLNEEMSADKCEMLLSSNSEKEEFAVRNREIFCLMRVHFSDSLTSKDYIGKKLKIPATARNWRTVNKILELAD